MVRGGSVPTARGAATASAPPLARSQLVRAQLSPTSHRLTEAAAGAMRRAPPHQPIIVIIKRRSGINHTVKDRDYNKTKQKITIEALKKNAPATILA